jgi:hypothetical protein
MGSLARQPGLCFDGSIMRWLIVATWFVSATMAQEKPTAVPPADSLTGRWTPDSRSKGGLGTTLIFVADGSVTSIGGAIVDFTYRVDGQTLTQAFREDATGSNTVMHQAFELKGDKLITEPADPQKRLEMTRIGGSAASIAGHWTYEFTAGTMAQLQYATNGTGQLCVPMQSHKGRYKLDGDVLTMEFPGEPSYARKIVLAGNHLTLLAEADRREQKFTRVSP